MWKHNENKSQFVNLQKFQYGLFRIKRFSASDLLYQNSIESGNSAANIGPQSTCCK